MYEVTQSATKAEQEPIAPEETYSPADNIAAASFLFWGEHGTECAAPSCYSCFSPIERANIRNVPSKVIALYASIRDKRIVKGVYGPSDNQPSG